MVEKTTARKSPDLSIEAREKMQKVIGQICLDCIRMLDEKPFLELSFTKEKNVYVDIVNARLPELHGSYGDGVDLVVRKRRKYPFEGDQTMGETSETSVFVLHNVFVGKNEKRHVTTREAVSSSLHSYDTDEKEAEIGELEKLKKLIEESDQYKAMMEKQQKD